MMIVGHPLIEHKRLHSIDEIDAIDIADKNLVLLFEYNEKLIEYCKKNAYEFALHVRNEKEAVLANALQASILICPHKIANKIQQLAENYLFDAKVAIIINSEDELDIAIEKRVDMAIFESAIT